MNMEPMISSDAVTEIFSKGVAIKVSDCSPNFQQLFSDAREAIVSNQQDAFERAVEEMVSYESDAGCKVPGKNALDVFEEIKDDSRPKSRPYPMTLLAYAGYHVRLDMIKYLIDKGADVDMGRPKCGTPLLQVFLYAHLQQMQQNLEHPMINIDVVKLFISQGAQLSRVISAGLSFNSSILTLAISFHNFEIAKVVVEERLDPVLGGDGEICPVFLEYYLFGSHMFLKWLLETHYSNGFKSLVDHILDENALFEDAQKHSFKVMGKNAVHAFLLCGHEEAIDYLVKENKKRHQQDAEENPDVLKEVDEFEKTALHLAAEEGDITSVKILLKHYEPDNVNLEDSSSMTPLMLATMNQHTEVVKLLQPPSLASRTTVGIKREILWALHYGYESYFEAMHATEEGEERLLEPVDNNGNNIAHLAVERGQVSVFKATFPRTRRTKSHSPLFSILAEKPGENSSLKKTPLQIAIEKGNVDMLNALQERRDERKKQVKKDDVLQQQAECYESKEWKKFWDEASPGLLLYACLHGTVEIVEYFVTKHVSPTTNISDRTPLSCAAQAGKSDIVAYLLSIDVPTTGYKDGKSSVPENYSPLMLASRFGRAKTAGILLDKGASIDVRSERRYNSLMEAIKAGHEDTAAALLKHNWPGREWMKAMNCRVSKSNTEVVDPLIMLIKEMPDVAQRVFTQCIIPDVNNESLEYNYYFLEQHCQQKVDEAVAGTSQTGAAIVRGGGATTTAVSQTSSSSGGGSGAQATTSFITPASPGVSATNPAATTQTGSAGSPTTTTPPWWLNHMDGRATEKQDDPPSHPLELMVRHKRLELLQHPLISRYISSKWWRLSPGIFGYLLLYIIFLVFLTSFALTVPRPGPDNIYCPSNDSGSSYAHLDLEDGECTEPDEVDRRAFTALAVLIIPLSILFFILHILLSVSSFKSKPDWPTPSATIEAFLRPWTFILTIIFVSGFSNDCWCAPPWQWQIGALSVFMAYINFILLLKGMPWLGIYINMLLKIVIEFMKLILLPFFLILSFAFPFYMLFVRDNDGNVSAGILEAFSSPAHSIAKTIVQTSGELDFETLFNDANLLYSPMAYFLFFSFVILMPILFLNLLVGLAVGTTDTDLKEATFNKIALQVGYISAMESLGGHIRILVHRYTSHMLRRWAGFPSRTYKGNSWLAKLRAVDYDTLNKLLVDDLYNETFMSDVQEDTAESQMTSDRSLRDHIDKGQQALQSDIREMQSELKVLKRMLEKK